jgi:hypothetical protein
MTALLLPLPDEPRALQRLARTALEQAPDTALPLVVSGAWIAEPLWDQWGEALQRRGMDREQFARIVADFGNELRLWVVGERPWEQYASGLVGRITRRLAPVAPAMNGRHGSWQDALGRVGMTPGAEHAALIARIGELHLLYEITAPCEPRAMRPGADAAFAIVWAGGRPRDPEVPFGEGRSGSPAEALAEALGRFLLKDPAYPPR